MSCVDRLHQQFIIKKLNMIKMEIDHWVEQQYKSNEEFKAHMDEVENSYKQAYQISIYSNLSLVPKKIIELVGDDSEGNKLFCIYGFIFPNDALLIEKTFLLMINVMDEVVDNLKGKKYTIIFFNTLCNSYEHFLIFKNMLKSLPKKYYKNLHKIIVVHPNLACRSIQMISFGILNNFIAKCLSFAERLQHLTQHQIDIIQLQKKLPKQIVNIDNSIELYKSQASMKQIGMVKNQLSNKIQKNKSYYLHLSEYEMTEFGIPVILKMFFNYFELKPDKLKQEGIFRKNSDIQELELLQKEMVKKNYQYIYHVENQYVICGFIKKIFNNLQEPIFGFEIYNKIIKNKGGDIQFAKSILKELPPLNFRTLQFTLSNLIEKVISFEHQNKMSAYNLSVCFSPCFFRPKEYKIEDLVFSTLFTKLLLILFTNFNELFGDKIAQEEAFKKTQQKKDKQRNKKVYNLIRRNSKIVPPKPPIPVIQDDDELDFEIILELKPSIEEMINKV